DGSYSFDTLDDFDYLAEGDTTSVTFAYFLQDSETDASGSPVYSEPATVTIEVVGVNDTPEFIGDDTGQVTEDSLPTRSSGKLEVVDPDNGESSIDASRAPQPVGDVLGSLRIASDGSWSYTVDNNRLQYLAEGETRDELFTVYAFDGTAHQITITINGTNDTPVISLALNDSDSASLTESTEVPAEELTATGTLSVSDIDVIDQVAPQVIAVSESLSTGL
ncbi:VCBS domain-containing protein, partial [Gilvimarinus xylanilyticus]